MPSLVTAARFDGRSLVMSSEGSGWMEDEWSDGWRMDEVMDGGAAANDYGGLFGRRSQQSSDNQQISRSDGQQIVGESITLCASQ